MTIVRGGQTGSGLDRALENALRAGLDPVLESGELYPGERTDFPDDYGPYDDQARPWQLPFDTDRLPPAADESVVAGLREQLRRRQPATTAESPAEAGRSAEPGRAAEPESPAPVQWHTPDREATCASRVDEIRQGQPIVTDADRARVDFRFRDDLTGVILVHGVGQQLAGQTLLDWTRPIVTLLADAAIADANRPDGERPRLKPLAREPRPVSDPVHKANIDFSGETFPVVQLRIPGRADVPEDDPRSNERRWMVTETWWAAEVRPPTLRAMIGWLGEEGGLGRILQGVQDHMLGRGLLGRVARVSLQAFVSVIAAVTLAFFALLIGVTRLVPFGPLKDFTALQLAGSWLTDGFGGARTLLRDPPQSANVRGRLVATIKALRAYGCRNVVIIGHSGGTMVSLQTLTDPAYERVQVEKLLTHGEAINLAWRLETEDQDAPRPTLPPGHRMLGDLADDQPRLLWRDFWATHDPASSGPPDLPEGMRDPGAPRFLAERVYNRMRISEDHGTFWDNDEHFLIPLIREIDTPTTDRSNSAFYSDAAESAVRARRKERVSVLSLWRRATFALPILAIVGALLVTGGGRLPDAGRLALDAWAFLPFHDDLVGFGRSISSLGATKVLDVLPDAVTWKAWYDLGLAVLHLALLLAVVLALVPARLDRLWRGRPVARVAMLVLDASLGLVPFAAIALAWLLQARPDNPAVALWNGAWDSGLPGLLVVGAVLVGLGLLGRRVRGWIDSLAGRPGYGDRFLRDGLIMGSAVVLALVPIVVLVAVIGVVLVLAGNVAAPDPDATRLLVLGAVVVLIGFQLLQRLGTWRWDTWDVRERRALRRRPLVHPFRNWSYFLAALLGGSAILAALLAALPRATAGDLLGPLVGLIAVVVMLSVGKDVVDNDIDTGAEAIAVIPDVKGPAAGASAG